MPQASLPPKFWDKDAWGMTKKTVYDYTKSALPALTFLSLGMRPKNGCGWRFVIFP